MDLFGPSDPTTCSSDTTKLGMTRTVDPDDDDHVEYEINSDCSCTMESLAINSHCRIEVGACILFPTCNDLEAKTVGFKGYAFPTDDKPCASAYGSQTRDPSICGHACVDANAQYYYNSTEAVTGAVTDFFTAARPDLGPICSLAAREAADHPELHRDESPEWYAVVDHLLTL